MRVFCLRIGVVAAASVSLCAAIGPASAEGDRPPQGSAADDKILEQPVDPWSPRETEAVAFTNGLTIRARAIFVDANLDAAARRRAFRALVAELFDVDRLGKALLGDHRARFNERQMASYQAVVPDYLVRLFASRIYEVCNTNPSVVLVEERSNGVLVRAAYGSDPGVRPTLVDWLLSPHPDGSWRVLDMAVNGVSVAQTKMEEFGAVLAAQSPDAFIELLQAQAGQGLPVPLSTPVEPEKRASE